MADGESSSQPRSDASVDDSRDHHAARTVQKTYRTYKCSHDTAMNGIYHADTLCIDTRESSGRNISSSARWNEALVNRQLKASADGADAGENAPTARWQRAGFYARRLIDDPPAGQDSGEEWDGSGETVHKNMEEKYWLEMVDRKHRKASNLNKYHEFWNNQYDGTENFFYWLDQGAGKDVNLEECPREKLESECVIYLNAEDRKNYLVKVSPDGKLVWAKDGQVVDTRRGFHRDNFDGRGVVDIDPNVDPDDDHTTATEDDTDGEPMVSDDDGSGIIDLGAGQQPLAPWTLWGKLKNSMKPLKPSAPAPIKKRKKQRKANEIAAGLRRPKGPKTWLFVVDTKANLYVSIKQAGKFQHSSFLFGSRVMAAGLIKVKQGTLTSLTPLSGHYKAGTPHFKHFVDLLKQSGCDMSHVSVNKGLITIGAIEHYGAMTKSRRLAVDHIKSLLMPGREPAAHQKQADEERKKSQREEAQRKGEAAKRMWESRELPHEGKKKEEMTDEERVERGVALVTRAMARGLHARRVDVEGRPSQEAVQARKPEKQHSISPDAETFDRTEQRA